MVNWLKRLSPYLTLGLLSLAVLAITLWPAVVHFVPPGHSSVQWRRFAGGTELVTVPGEGVIWTYPWDQLAIYDVRVQLTNISIDVLMLDGLTITVDMSVRFHLDVHKLGYLQRFVGPDYLEKLIVPAMSAEARNILALYTADNVYSANRRSLQSQVEERVTKAVRLNIATDHDEVVSVVYVSEVLFLSIRLPATIADAIERKNVERQRVELLEFAIQAEDQERRRKIVEGNGIRSFHEIIRNSLSDQFLKWKGIDATLQLAMSPNAKIIVVGNGSGGLPVMFSAAEGTPEKEKEKEKEQTRPDPARGGQGQRPSAPGMAR